MRVAGNDPAKMMTPIRPFIHPLAALFKVELLKMMNQ
jgi:hypothetical protein